MSAIVSAEQWMALAAHDGTFSSSRHGLTPTAETRVWGKRTLDENLIYFCTHHGFSIVFANKVVRINRGSFCWIMPGVEHATQLLAPRRAFRTYYIRFNLTGIDGTTPARLVDDFIQRDDAWRMFNLVADLVNELQSPQMFHEQRLRGTLMLLAASALGPQSVQGAVLTAQQRLRLQSFVEMHVAEKITSRNLADEIGLSMPYFRRIFHPSFGMSAKHWIVRQRILVAALMLSETEMKAKEIAYRLGYCDRYQFSRQFKQIMGITPRAFRRGSGMQPAWHPVGNDMKCTPEFRKALDAGIDLLRKNS